jgi:dihydroorotate dehydrogenase (fumarate)
MPDLSTRYLGLDLKNPILVGSCGLTASADNVAMLEDAGAGGVVLKSLFEEQILAQVRDLSSVEGQDQVARHPEALDYITSYGQADAFAWYLDLIADAKRRVSMPVVASVHCLSAGAWTDYAHKLEKAGADALELNVFALPSSSLTGSQEMERTYFDVLESVRRSVAIPLALKVGSYFSSLARTMESLSRSGANSLVLFNRFYHPDVDIEKFSLVPSELFSTPQDYTQALRWVSILSGRVGCDLVATTGIHDGKTVIKLLLAGATAVEVVSTLYHHGVDRLGGMLSEISGWMRRHGFSSVEDFRGKLRQGESADPAAYERVQFMKATVGVE